MEHSICSPLFPRCVGLGIKGDTLQVRVGSWDEAWKLNQSYLPYLTNLGKCFGKNVVELVHNTPNKPFIPIWVEMSVSPGTATVEDSPQNITAKDFQAFQLSESNAKKRKKNHRGGQTNMLSLQQVAELANHSGECDAELAALALGEKNIATWIIDQATQEVLLANRFALDANCKPPREVLAKDISALWEEEPLRELTDLVHRDTLVREHTNRGYRWHKEPGTEVWLRKKHDFTVDYAEVDFLGRVCRFEIVKEAMPV
ncbi:hypothetical protein [Phormidium sp. CCY1219]|uniref:hypothetical protein n=1 Tax=Phormidium sp. CCY1219 TaxID=2886104 RepID=UPI002D1E7FDA|nr:hypothetical protein [Phormidium sp. CCY1219]MEB3830112.1 hypothetical protein [Phormidium sp. CCY1219]